MTAPEQAQTAEDQDSSQLIPALLAAYASYQIYRAARGEIDKDWQLVVAALGLPALIGAVLAQIALRALTRQRSQAGRAGDVLWQFSNQGMNAGYMAGMQAVAQALIYTDEHTGTKAQTRDDGGQTDGDPSGLIPTPENPPEILAEITARATANGAQTHVAELAGWTTKTWISMRDGRVRDTHANMDGQTQPLGSPFVSPSGATLMFPCDPTAPIEETAGCRCGLRTSRR